MIMVRKKKAAICKVFFKIESLEIFPRKMPRKMMHIMIMMNATIKVPNPALRVKKNGTIGTIPPKNGLKPFTKDTNTPVNLSAFS